MIVRQIANQNQPSKIDHVLACHFELIAVACLQIRITREDKMANGVCAHIDAIEEVKHAKKRV
jgi:hypothetical protein